MLSSFIATAVIAFCQSNEIKIISESDLGKINGGYQIILNNYCDTHMSDYTACQRLNQNCVNLWIRECILSPGNNCYKFSAPDEVPLQSYCGGPHPDCLHSFVYYDCTN